MPVRAKCHGCQDAKSCTYCTLCDHYFCAACWPQWMTRTASAIRQIVSGRTALCCGPDALSAVDTLTAGWS